MEDYDGQIHDGHNNDGHTTTVQNTNQSKPARPTRSLNVVRIESKKALFWSTVYSDGGDHA